MVDGFYHSICGIAVAKGTVNSMVLVPGKTVAAVTR